MGQYRLATFCFVVTPLGFCGYADRSTDAGGGIKMKNAWNVFLIAPLALCVLTARVAPVLAQNGAQNSGGTHPMSSNVHGRADVTFTLVTGIASGKMAFIGRGGNIDGAVNPTLTVREGDQVQINLINGEGAEHDIVIPDFRVASQHVVGKGGSSSIVFTAGNPGSYFYFCSIPGHREAGMQGTIKVELTPTTAKAAEGISIDRDPTDLPPPIGDRAATNVRVDLEAIERVGRLDEKTTYGYWTFNGKVPGPFLRVRVGDTIELHLKNDASSAMYHSVDLHAVNGTGGGAAFTEVEPGQDKGFVFKALTPGLFVYHCATPMVANHISNGMYGLILVEPPAGLPKVDHEFYVMQGELYTTSPFGTQGAQEFDFDKLVGEQPSYFVFNGSVGALSKEHPLQAKVGETIRIFFGVGGPNFTSSFHVIGQIFDRAYEDGGLTAPPLTGIQTISVPPGSAAMVEFTAKVPGRFTIVDHALSRLEKGLAGSLIVTGPAQPDIFREATPREKQK